MKAALSMSNYSQLQSWMEERDFSKIFILVDSHTHQYCLAALQTQVKSLRDAEVLEVEPGEQSKDIEIVTQLWQALIELGADRKSLLVNLGGGMITDLGGFVASTFKRGIPFIHIPSTVLSMVDAAIGGKTGINISHIKNQIGSFATPEAIVRIPAMIDSLPEREYFSGAAEMIKHFLISSSDDFNGYLEQLAMRTHLSELIDQSAAIKEKIVVADPFEKDVRKHLNLGHTLGHAIEAETMDTNKALLHGEAVIYGMIFALRISAQRFMLDEHLLTALTAFARKHYPPLPALAAENLWQHMLHDKKNEAGEVRMVLLKKQGTPVIDQVLTNDDFTRDFQAFAGSFEVN